MIDTEWVNSVAGVGAPLKANEIKNTPLGRIGQPEDIGKVAAFLASDDASWVTGKLLNMSGGLTI